MATSDSTTVSTPSLQTSRCGSPRSHFVRFFRGRRGIVVLASPALALAAALNWNWLAAVGVTPVLLSMLPFVAMCVTGLCMNKITGRVNGTAPADMSDDPTAPSTMLPPSGHSCCSVRQGLDAQSPDAV